MHTEIHPSIQTYMHAYIHTYIQTDRHTSMHARVPGNTPAVADGLRAGSVVTFARTATGKRPFLNAMSYIDISVSPSAPGVRPFFRRAVSRGGQKPDTQDWVRVTQQCRQHANPHAHSRNSARLSLSLPRLLSGALHWARTWIGRELLSRTQPGTTVHLSKRRSQQN